MRSRLFIQTLIVPVEMTDSLDGMTFERRCECLFRGRQRPVGRVTAIDCNQPTATFDISGSAVQRVPKVGAARRAHADCHEEAFEYGDRPWPEWSL